MSENEPKPVEALFERITAAVIQRQSLRAGGAQRRELERNRVHLLGLQRELSYALIARHLPAAAGRAA